MNNNGGAIASARERRREAPRGRCEMKKVLTARSDNFSGTVRDFARSVMGVSSGLLKRTKHPGRMLVNGQAVFADFRMKPGDVLELVIEQEEDCSPGVEPSPGETDIVYRDEDILVLNKPAPLPVHPSKGRRDDSLAGRVTAYFLNEGVNYVTRIVNRLDKGTSGLTVFAMHAFAHEKLQKQLHGDFIREYFAVTKGVPHPAQGTVDAPIMRAEGPTIKRIVAPNGQRAVTHYRVIEENGDAALLRLRLDTGRTHQIRVHMAHIGHPLIGDFLYGCEDERIERCALHSCYISLVHPVSGRRMEFFRDMPEDMQALIREKRNVREQKHT